MNYYITKCPICNKKKVITNDFYLFYCNKCNLKIFIDEAQKKPITNIKPLYLLEIAEFYLYRANYDKALIIINEYLKYKKNNNYCWKIFLIAYTQDFNLKKKLKKDTLQTAIDNYEKTLKEKNDAFFNLCQEYYYNLYDENDDSEKDEGYFIFENNLPIIFGTISAIIIFLIILVNIIN